VRYPALACDFDGTLARRGVVSDETAVALERLRHTGRIVMYGPSPERTAAEEEEDVAMSDYDICFRGFGW
jgi:hypothetical protein